MKEFSYGRKQTLLLILVIFAVLVSLRFTKSFDNALSWDVKGYYLYLPAIFIYDDPLIQDVSWVEEAREKYQTASTLYMLNRTGNGSHVIKYTSGLAMLYAPFFFAGHLLATISRAFPTDGFSLPYQYAVALGMFLYVFAGIWFLRKILHHYFDDKTVFFTLLVLLAGTNLVNQFSFHTLLSHTPLFSLVSVLIWCTIRFYQETEKPGQEASKNRVWHPAQSQARLYLFFSAALCGMITLIRPTEIVCLLLFALWGVGSWRTFTGRISFFFRRPLWVLIFGLTMLFVALPQLFYWKTLTGEYFHYSYENAGEGLDFLYPHTLKFLFSFRKGWLVYTPLMILATAGFVPLYRRKRELFFSILVYFLVSLYLMSSWTTWWYAGGCFSSRTVISVYPALAIPLGMSVASILNFRKFFRMTIAGIAAFLILLNLFHTWQFQKGILPLETMTREYYFRSFLKTSVTEDDKELLLVSRPLTTVEHFRQEEKYNQRVLFKDVYSPDAYPEFRFSDKAPLTGMYSMVLDSLSSFSPVRTYLFSELTGTDHAWLRAKAEIFIPEGFNEGAPMLVMTFLHKGKHYKYRSSEVQNIPLIPGEWNAITFDYITPEVRRRSDVLQVYIWYRGKTPIFVHSFEVKVFERTRRDGR